VFPTHTALHVQQTSLVSCGLCSLPHTFTSYEQTFRLLSKSVQMWLSAAQRDILFILSIKRGLNYTKNCLLELLPRGLKLFIAGNLETLYHTVRYIA
jgi:hypothetical protein